MNNANESSGTAENPRNVCISPTPEQLNQSRPIPEPLLIENKDDVHATEVPNRDPNFVAIGVVENNMNSDPNGIFCYRLWFNVRIIAKSFHIIFIW